MITFKGKKYKTTDDFHNKWMKYPAYKKAYHELDLEFSIISAIIEARITKGLTQKKLAEKMGTKQSSIARFESGHYNPSLAFVQKLANAIGVKIKVS
ncbi:MAG: transcriptional regulator [Candidatus Zambryskibacteria bacterium CG10_big_fil_rev_8_21_14_0_10_34_34]|uniref:Transcriptional regulator n=1 Tax=Candidatus Zambryskibacteria bacterium CG10_big_fil_rev_8_21_14_0_10_34_34 TaxID=1975114 RepID=A0A2H0R150_9BACT|nr:MAG: transcriptional regulator [Candidatus Zambryskibacteria bacterium CG10_big_fil_rev_8_21_14_0_10_34_34]